MKVYYTKNNIADDLTSYIFSNANAKNKAVNAFKKSGSKKCFMYIERRYVIPMLQKRISNELFGIKFIEM